MLKKCVHVGPVFVEGGDGGPGKKLDIDHKWGGTPGTGGSLSQKKESEKHKGNGTALTGHFLIRWHKIQILATGHLPGKEKVGKTSHDQGGGTPRPKLYDKKTLPKPKRVKVSTADVALRQQEGPRQGVANLHRGYGDKKEWGLHSTFSTEGGGKVGGGKRSL